MNIKIYKNIIHEKTHKKWTNCHVMIIYDYATAIKIHQCTSMWRHSLRKFADERISQISPSMPMHNRDKLMYSIKKDGNTSIRIIH